VLSLEDRAQVPAQEAGALVKILVREGQQVAAGELLAQIDDVVPQMAYNVAGYKLEVAKRQATDDVDVRYAKKGAEVYTVKYQKSLEANAKTPGVYTQVELLEQKLERDKFILSIEKAQKDLDVAGLQMQVSEAEKQAAEANLKRRKITAPLDGRVVDVSCHVGEWVQQGETVMRLVPLDRLRVDGDVSAKDYLPWEIRDRPVSVVVEFARGQRQTFPGKIVFVSPEVNSGYFKVRAEVQNRKQNGVWVLSPGLPAEMTIQLK
jgi:multidrug efflux pump subunit AcrA (membrane-fusion protein)